MQSPTAQGVACIDLFYQRYCVHSMAARTWGVERRRVLTQSEAVEFDVILQQQIGLVCASGASCCQQSWTIRPLLFYLVRSIERAERCIFRKRLWFYAVAKSSNSGVNRA